MEFHKIVEIKRKKRLPEDNLLCSLLQKRKIMSYGFSNCRKFSEIICKPFYAFPWVNIDNVGYTYITDDSTLFDLICIDILQLRFHCLLIGGVSLLHTSVQPFLYCSEPFGVLPFAPSICIFICTFLNLLIVYVYNLMNWKSVSIVYRISYICKFTSL